MSKIPQEKPLVLVVDDERMILAVVKRVLEDGGVPVDVLLAGGVTEAKAAILESLSDGRKRISAVLTDWNMNDGIGAEVVEAAHDAEIASVGVMTGRIEDNQEDIRATGVTLILEKAFDRDELRWMIALLLGPQSEAKP